MRSKENCVDSLAVMEIAFQNIMDEIIEHVIEGICFEAHRAVKLGYFPVYEYILKDNQFDIYEDKESLRPVGANCDIFGNVKKNIKLLAECPYCLQKKAANSLIRHMKKCLSRNVGLDSNDKGENYENNVDDDDSSDGNDNFERKKIDARKQAKSVKNYDTMTPEEKQDFLLTRCGVISKFTRKPCSNPLSCTKHGQEDKDAVRRFIFESLGDHLVDDNIDIDTVD